MLSFDLKCLRIPGRNNNTSLAFNPNPIEILWSLWFLWQTRDLNNTKYRNESPTHASVLKTCLIIYLERCWAALGKIITLAVLCFEIIARHWSLLAFSLSCVFNKKIIALVRHVSATHAASFPFSISNSADWTVDKDHVSCSITINYEHFFRVSCQRLNHAAADRENHRIRKTSTSLLNHTNPASC